MDAVSLEELELDSGAFDAAVLASDGIDYFCSASDWCVPAARALMPPRQAWIRRGEHGYAAFMRGQGEARATLQPLEVMWALGCPLLGADAAGLSRELCAELASDRDAALILSGFEPESRRLGALVAALERRYQLVVGPVTTRRVASLAGGVDGFLGRRSPELRRGLSRARRRARAAGVELERFADGPLDQAFTRLLAIDDLSWKGAAGVGLNASQMADFYRVMLPRLARRGALRLSFARVGEVDVGYVLGGVLGDTYRGLQFGFARGHERLSLGNLLQLHEIERLCGEGTQRYDLGTEYPYKTRWAEQQQTTITLFALPR